jgi:hypothetical protein
MGNEIKDPTLERERKRREREAAAAKKAAAEEQRRKTEGAAGAAHQKNLFIALYEFTDPSIVGNGFADPKTFGQLYDFLQTSYQDALQPNATPQDKQYYEEDKKKVLALAKGFEKKYKVSFLDVLNYGKPVAMPGGGTFNPQKDFDSNFLYTVASDNPDKSIKFLKPKTFGPETTVPTAGDSFVTPPLSPEEQAKKDSLDRTPTITDARRSNGLTNVYDGLDAQGNQVFWWNGNNNADAHVFIVGDTNGKYIPSTSGEAAYKAGSPVGAQEFIDHTIERYRQRPGGITELKQMLADRGGYPSDAVAARAMQMGDVVDATTRGAVQNILSATSAANMTRIRQNKNKDVSLINFDGYLRSGAKLPSTAAIGNGNNGTVVQHQSFRPEEYEIAIDQLFQATIGRGASDSELNDFLDKLRAYEKTNPQTDTYTGQGTNAETLTSGGGVGQPGGYVAQALLRESALAQPGAEKNAKENKYFGYLMEALAPTNASQLG